MTAPAGLFLPMGLGVSAMCRLPPLTLLLLAASTPLTAGADFDRDIRPLLQARCVNCHGPEKDRGGLRLDGKTQALRGGDSGAALVPGKPGDSLLLQRVTTTDPGERMPPKGAALSAAEIARLRAWIAAGARWPEATPAAVEPTHWAFQPLRRPAVPVATGPDRSRSPIDRFLLARLHRERLTFAPEAERTALLRRLAFDVVGLPPTPEEMRCFLDDRHPLAYERQVDTLLASPAHGERWARHWLDVARFAESDGFETNQPRPNAWPYRDWVIAAFNRDLPYDRFVSEQLAGDVLGADAATGFLVAGPYDRVKSPDPVLTAQQRADELHDIVGTTGAAFLGLTVGCARCHNHKFDPVSQTDYYALKAVFAGVRHGERRLADPDRPTMPDDALAALPGRPFTAFRPAVHTGRNVDRFAPTEVRFIRFTIRATNTLEPCLDEVEVFTAGEAPRNVALASAGTRVTASGSYAGHAIHRLEHVHDGRVGNSFSWISSETGRGWVRLELPTAERIDRVVWSRDRTVPPRFQDRLATDYLIEVSLDGKTWQAVASAADRAGAGRTTMAYVGQMTAPDETFRLHRGEVTQPREKVGPGVLTGPGQRVAIDPAAPGPRRRLELARWISDPKNPLTARVAVNRLWQHHFGTGLVETPGDFGRNGARPSHPELLDWLACELIDSGWSLKHVHRLILHSAAYRQSSRPQAEGLARDASSRLLWRYPPRRLEAEAIRDAVLAVSGVLDRRAGGPGFDLFEPNSNYVKVYTPKATFGPETFRRMVYQARPRMQLDDTFGAFDCPDAGQIAPRRSASTTPLQALNLLHSPFALQQASLFARRLAAEAGSDPRARVRRAFALAFGRDPADDEEPAAIALVRTHGSEALCRALLNANEFLYLR